MLSVNLTNIAYSPKRQLLSLWLTGTTVLLRKSSQTQRTFLRKQTSMRRLPTSFANRALEPLIPPL